MKLKLNRRQFISLLAVGIVASVSLRAEGEETKSKPNVLYIFADQMRFSAMGNMAGVSGAGKEPDAVRTPNLDKVAREGLLFTHAFSTTPVCSAYRVGLQTGKYCHKVGYRLDPKETTLAHVLKAQGYSTGYIGKWHMHGSENKPRGFVEPERRVGWDFFAGHEVTHRYFNTCYYLNNDRTPIPVKDGAYEAEVQTDLAIRFLNQQTRETPFCLFLSWGPPHNPYRPPKRYDTHRPEDVPIRPNVAAEYREAAREQLSKYYGQVESLDELLGRILKTLESLGLADNTILCFSSDHGDMHYSHKHEDSPRGAGYKRRPFEESARIPFIMRWPQRIAPGQKTDLLFGSVNVMPTLLGLCGAPIPEQVQGENLCEAILKSKPGPDSVFLQQTASGNTAFRSPWRAIRTRKYLYATSGHTGNGGWLLYDMEKDPYQMSNLIDDPAFSHIRDKLCAQLKAWREKTGDHQDMQADHERAMRVIPNRQRSRPL
ncbi:sulfatase-like hydrolase/transferase [Petrachloros mirabilis]